MEHRIPARCLSRVVARRDSTLGTLPGQNGPCSGASVTFAQGRNRFRGPGYVTTDLAVMKNTNIPHWENAVFAFGLQFFNLFNHANFGFPDNSSSDSTFGADFLSGAISDQRSGVRTERECIRTHDSAESTTTILMREVRPRDQKFSIIQTLLLLQRC